MAGNVSVGRPDKALWLYNQMFRSGIFPNEFTLATAVNACSVLAEIRSGKKIHAHVELLGLGDNLVVCSSLVDMYGKCNDVDEARRVFEAMGEKNIVSWTSMVSAYAQNALGNEALSLFKEFITLIPNSLNQFMLTSVISACASLGKLDSGKVAHGAVIQLGHDGNDVVGSALLDMYAKCGSFDYCNKVFRRMENPSVIAYTSMIVGAAKYGLGKLSVQLLEDMVARNIKPNQVTFIGVLHGCSHSGLVNQGLKYLETMLEKYHLVPDSRHYTCIVDMLGRAGRVDEAYMLAKSIPVGPNEGALLWGTLLSMSRLLGRVDIAAEASDWLIRANQQVAGAYVTMSNTFTLVGDWRNANNIRFQMKRDGIRKEPGCSWINVRDSSYVFYSGKLGFWRCEEVVALLREMELRMKERGYKGGSVGLVFVEMEEESKEEMVSLHSERLALGFGLLCLPKGHTLRIFKNLRMCWDCHEAFKLMSEIVGREFIVRDVNRFHHFNKNSCTCRDFW